MGEIKTGGIRKIEQIVYLWNNIVDMPRLNGNGYRVLLDIAINFNGNVTQKEFLEKRAWKQPSVSNTLGRLVQNEYLLCMQIPRTRKMEYVINPMLLKPNNVQKKVNIDLCGFIKVWDIIRELSFMSSNNYRVFIDILLFYDKVSPAEICKKREWKVSPTYESFKKLYEHELLLCVMERGQTMYSVNKKYFQI